LVYAAVRYLLASGNTCCTIEQIEQIVNWRYRDIQSEVRFGKALINACLLDMPSLCQYRMVDGQSHIYINHVWEEECSILQHLERLSATRKKYQNTYGVEDVEKEIGIRYNKGQRQAFRLLETSGLKILTGPPGSGKTAVVNGLIRCFEKNKNGTVHLAATTGMAAKVMRAATDRDSETVNLMLHVLPYDDTVKGRDLNDPVDADLIIVDEVSMMGLQLFSALVQAIRNGSIVLLVGDEDQLQSVDYGNVLHDMIASDAVEVCRLTEILRQSGAICENAMRINAGNQRLVQDHSFQVNPIIDLSSLKDMLLRDYDKDRSQIICPVKQGEISTWSINNLIQDWVNGDSPVVAAYGKRVFREQDKIIMTKTNYDRGYINGDIGYILEKTIAGELVIQFHSGTLQIKKEDLCDMDLAYAITIHKSQGSEFPLVHIVLPSHASHMMSRRLLYTAVTRAKQQVMIYSQGDSMRDAIADKGERRRYTLLTKQVQKKFAILEGGN
jgi:exodeoxyribonuclease V alpha subunit